MGERELWMSRMQLSEQADTQPCAGGIAGFKSASQERMITPKSRHMDPLLYSTAWGKVSKKWLQSYWLKRLREENC